MMRTRGRPGAVSVVDKRSTVRKLASSEAGESEFPGIANGFQFLQQNPPGLTIAFGKRPGRFYMFKQTRHGPFPILQLIEEILETL